VKALYPEISFRGLRELLYHEVRERFEEGYDIDIDEFKLRIDKASSVEELLSVYGEMVELEIRDDYGYVEPSDWNGICRERAGRFTKFGLRLSTDELRDRILGGWLGRCAGCMLGKPVEGWSRERIRQALRRAGEYPLRNAYFPLKAFSDLSARQVASIAPLTRGNISRAERDDDLDYTLLNLLVYERCGDSFTSMDIADEWLLRLPYHLVYTAERAAYRNLVIGLKPPDTATFLNPYREWIGAQIRADFWGYVSPGDPERAVEYAFRDASLSHVKNGIYGELYMAALISLAYVCEDPLKLVEEGMKAIPHRSRLAEALRFVLALYHRGLDWEEAVDEILLKLGHYHPVHTINNAAIVVAALLWGEGDYSRTVTYAVLPGLDTDCNGATAGSIMGVILGASRIPREWVDPLGDRLATALSGLGVQRVSVLAERTLKCVLRDE